MANDIQIRPELIKAGYSDADVGYDPTRKMTTLRGQDFLGAGNFTNVARSTFTDRQNFDSALKKFRQGIQPSTQLGATGVNGITGAQPTSTPADQRYTDLVNMLYQQAQAPQQVDPNAIYGSPQYAAAQAQAQRGAQQGIRSAQEALGSAGFGRSTALGESAQREQNIANEYLQTQVLPQLMAQEEARRQQQTQEQFRVLDALTRERESARQFGLQEAGLTGKLYGEQERAAQPLLDQLTSLGEAWQRGTPEQKATYSQQADDIRAQLTQMGIDPSLYAPGLTTGERRTAGQELGTPTLGAQQLERERFESDRAFELAKGQQEWENTMAQGQFDLNKAQQIWENTFKERNFQQDMKEAAASRGLQWANLDQRNKEFIADQEFREKQFEEQKAETPKLTKNEVEAEYYANLDKMNEAQLKSFFANEKANIIADLGKSGYDALKEAYKIYE
jgi:hypothetical protein